MKKKPNDISPFDRDELLFQFKPTTICPLPATNMPATFTINRDGDTKQGYMPEWKKEMGEFTVTISSLIQYGYPYGKDILIILYLVKEALKQNSRIIKFKNIKHFLETFEIDTVGKNYKYFKEAFLRIRYSTWYWGKKGATDQMLDIDYKIIGIYILITKIILNNFLIAL
jgi:hypothetical protein